MVCLFDDLVDTNKTVTKHTLKTEIQRINGYLREVITYVDQSGKVTTAINPLMVELKPRDMMQIFVGSFLIAAPLSFTEEVWVLGQEITTSRVLTLAIFSFSVMTLYTYFQHYRGRMKGYVMQFIKRIIATYVIAASSAVMMLYLIGKLPLETDPHTAVSRVILISFPALFGAVLSDSLK